jgi:hypothetical protein
MCERTDTRAGDVISSLARRLVLDWPTHQCERQGYRSPSADHQKHVVDSQGTKQFYGAAVRFEALSLR